MTTVRFLTFLLVLVGTVGAAPLKDHITIDALVVTKAELRRHMAASEDDRFRPATYADLQASSGPGQAVYLVVRFLAKTPGHDFGEAEARIDGNRNGTKLNVMLHFNKGWVEYFIPLDSLGWRSMERDGTMIKLRSGGPAVVVDWNRLESK